MVATIASEYRQGRCLPISTTKLDVARPATWNTGAIAASSAAGVRMPIIDIMLDAASRRRTEVHVGGAVTAPLFLYPSAGDWRQMTKRPSELGMPKLHVVRNAQLTPAWHTVE